MVMQRLRTVRRQRRAGAGTLAVVAMLGTTTVACAMTSHESHSTTPAPAATRSVSPLPTATPRSTAQLDCGDSKGRTDGVIDYAPNANGSPTVLAAIAPYASPSYPAYQAGDHAKVLDVHEQRAAAAVLRADGSARMLLTLFRRHNGWLVDTTKECSDPSSAHPAATSTAGPSVKPPHGVT